MAIHIGIGCKFKHDLRGSEGEKVIWHVKACSSAMADIWLCEVISKCQFQGEQQLFTSEAITAAILSDEEEAALSSQQRFWKNLCVGGMVHYHHGFQQYVRCEIVDVPNEDVNFKFERYQLKPVALVGKWDANALPRRNKFGEIVEGFFPKMMAEGGVFRPHCSNIFEYHGFHPVRGKNPEYMEPINLSVPDMTLAEINLAMLHRCARDVAAQLQDDSIPILERLCVANTRIKDTLLSWKRANNEG